MGRLIIATQEDEAPDTLDRHLKGAMFEVSELVPQVTETNRQFLEECLAIGGRTPTGAGILATIADSPTDIYLIGVVANDSDSHFDPAIPGAVFNFLSTGYFPSADPQPVRSTMMLFHELGHVVQWLTKRAWFETNSRRSQNGYFAEIEKDNLIMHEWPICKDLGHPIRPRYEDMFASPEKAKHMWDAVVTIQGAWREKLARMRNRAPAETAT